jgi:hypothetical protein
MCPGIPPDMSRLREIHWAALQSLCCFVVTPFLQAGADGFLKARPRKCLIRYGA